MWLLNAVAIAPVSLDVAYSLVCLLFERRANQRALFRDDSPFIARGLARPNGAHEIAQFHSHFERRGKPLRLKKRSRRAGVRVDVNLSARQLQTRQTRPVSSGGCALPNCKKTLERCTHANQNIFGFNGSTLSTISCFNLLAALTPTVPRSARARCSCPLPSSSSRALGPLRMPS